MKKKFLCLLLAACFLLGSCDGTVPSDTTASPDTASGTTGAAGGTGGVTTDAGQTEIVYDEYENIVSEPADNEGQTIRIEAEKYDSADFSFNNVAGSEFSGGTLLRCFMKKIDSEYKISYTVNVNKAGKYRLTALCAETSRTWTSDFFVSVNGSRVIDAAGDGRVLSDFPSATMNDADLLKVTLLGDVELSAGDNTIVFEIDKTDLNSDGFISFFMDYFEVSNQTFSGESYACVYYDAELPETDSETLLAAATVHVFDGSRPLRIELSTTAEENEKTVEYSLTDYFGSMVFSGELKAVNGKTILKKGVKNHATGYFKLKVGDAEYDYVVTPPLSSRLEDSPFAADFASYYLVNGEKNVYNLSCAAKLAGITWVRERADWVTYEPQRGVYDFTSTEAKFKAIDKAGLKLLTLVYGAPSWAYGENYPVSSGTLGSFRDSQLDAYKTFKAMAEYYKGVVDGWELWNESDGNFAGETADLFAAWYKAAALGVEDANTGAALSYGGFCTSNKVSDYMPLAYMNDILDYSDIYNYHFHVVGGSSDFVDFTSGTPVIDSKAYNYLYNTTGKPVWITEAGMKLVFADGVTAPTEEQLTNQTPYVVTSAVQSLSTGTDKHFWFILAPYIEAGGDFGTFSADLSPYPSLAAEAVMTYMLGQGRYTGELSGLPNNAYGELFDTGSGFVATVFSEKTMSYTFSSASAVIVTDLMGGQKTVEPENGKITIELSTVPQYISYASAPAYYQQDYADAGLKTDTEYTVGQRVIISPEFDVKSYISSKASGYKLSAEEATELTVRITNLNSVAVSGSVLGLLEGFTVTGGDNVSVEAYSYTKTTLTLTPDGSKIDNYLRLTGKFNSSDTSAAVSRVYTSMGASERSVKLSGLAEDRKYDASALTNVKAKFTNVSGSIGVTLNGKAFEGFTESAGGIVLDFSGLSAGKYYLTVSVLTQYGERVYDTAEFYIK